MTTKNLGVLGERVAERHLTGLGYAILARNWRCSSGEIDLIALQHEPRTVVFCEVKCRSGRGFGDPLEAITHAKLTKLRELAQLWLREQPSFQPAVRLDAVGVLLEPGQAPQITHVEAIDQ